MIDFLQNSWLALLLTAVIAYLLGSINSAILITRAFCKKDIRDFGSGNAGATNVLRSQGVLPAALTGAGDLLKSLLAVQIGSLLLCRLQLMPPADTTEAMWLMYNEENLKLVGAYLAGIFCILGHLYPLYFGFRGGKGVVAGFGLVLFLDWRIALVLLGVFVIVFLITRWVSLGSIIAAILLPICTYLSRTFFYKQEWETVWFCTVCVTVISLIVLVKHRSNIKRIAEGTENKL